MGENKQESDAGKLSSKLVKYKVGKDSIYTDTAVLPGEAEYVVRTDRNRLAETDFTHPFDFREKSLDRAVSSHELVESAVSQELKGVYVRVNELAKKVGLDIDDDSLAPGIIHQRSVVTPDGGVLWFELIQPGYKDGGWVGEPAIKIMEARKRELRPSLKRKIIGKVGFNREEYEELELTSSGTGKYRQYRPKYPGVPAKDDREALGLVLAEVRGSKNIQPDLLVSSAKSMVDRAARIVEASKSA